MSQSNQDISKFFPRLNIDVLKVHAARWAKRWPNVPIDRIILYNYASEFQKYADEPIKYKKYAVVFEISIVDKLRILTPKGQFRFDFAVASGKIEPDPFYKFAKDIEYNTSVEQNKKYKALITEDFTNVYWEKPDDEFRREWVFIPRTLVYDKKEKNLIFEGLPVNVRLAEPNEILFQADKISKLDVPSEDIEDEIIEEGPYDFIAKKEISEKQYIFRPTGPTWHISYDGNDLFGLKGKGFGYIHFLVKHKRKKYHTDELAIEVDKISDPDILDKLKQDPTERTDNNDYDNKKKKGTDHRDMVNGKSKIDLMEHWKYLKQEHKKATDDNDPMRIDKTRKELETFEDDYFKLVRPGGKSRQFINDTKKNQDRISKNIKRALEKIKKYDKLTWQHFKSALDPIHAYYLSYTPDRHINWLTE